MKWLIFMSAGWHGCLQQALTTGQVAAALNQKGTVTDVPHCVVGISGFEGAAGAVKRTQGPLDTASCLNELIPPVPAMKWSTRLVILLLSGFGQLCCGS